MFVDGPLRLLDSSKVTLGFDLMRLLCVVSFIV